MVDPASIPPKTDGFTVGREGGTEVLLPPHAEGQRGPARRTVPFFNPAMALSRDLTVALVAAEARRRGRRLSVWDAHAASGIRGLRLLSETSAVERLLSTDEHPAACELTRQNAEREGSGRMEVKAHDSRQAPSGQFDWVDIDPFGTPVPFLHAGVEATADGGILAVTATDMAVLAGPETRTCLERYGARTIRGYLSREGALRILLAQIAREAAGLQKEVYPLVSLISGYFVRVHVRVSPTGASPVDPAGLGPVPFPGYDGPPLPGKGPYGPMWRGHLQDRGLLGRVMESPPATIGPPARRILELLQGEAEVDTLFYYETGPYSRRLHLSSPPAHRVILETIRAAGYRAVRTHAAPSGWRTDAPSKVMEGLF